MSDDATTTGVAPIGKVGRGTATLDPDGVRGELELAFATARPTRITLNTGEQVDGKVAHVGEALLRVSDRILVIADVDSAEPISDPRPLEAVLSDLLAEYGGYLSIVKDEAGDWGVHVTRPGQDDLYGYGDTLQQALGEALG